MYKLVAVGGKLRGQEFVLEEGENTLGRSDDCDITLGVNGVSKKHMSITVTDDVAYVQDMGSSNGTFLNGNIIKRATAKNGDKIALPDLILQVVYVKEKKVIVKKKSSPKDFEKFIDKLYTVGVQDLKIVENFEIHCDDDFEVEETENTICILNRYIDEAEMDCDKTIVKGILQKIYAQACEVE